MQIDVFTLVPHAYAWLTEQRPLAAVLGDGLDLRLFNYRDTSPLSARQVDDEPYGGGAGMVLRVDVVAAALDAVYGGAPDHRVVAMTPGGRQLTQEVVEELAGEERLTILSARFEGFDERIVANLASDAISIGPYVLSNGDLPAMVLVDGVVRLLPGRARECGVERARELLRGARARSRVPALHATRGVPRLDRARRAALGGPSKGRRVAARAEPAPEHPRMRNPIERLGLPHAWTVALDWFVTIVGAVAIVLAIKAWVVNPYRIPTSSMEPRLHCAAPGPGCLARFSDRVLANRFIYHFTDPERGDIVVFNTPPRAEQQCPPAGTFVKRIVALPGETWEERDGVVYINGRKLNEPYIPPGRNDFETYEPQQIPDDAYFVMGDNRTQSCDSRRWGTVPRENMIGKVFATYWPPNRISFR